MRRKDKNLLNLVKKKKRLAPPFHSKVEGGAAQRRPDRYRLGGDVGHLKDGGKWIGKARASMERRGTVGSLRKAMGTKSGETIPTGSLEAKKAQAKRTGNTKMMRKVNFALNVRK